MHIDHVGLNVADLDAQVQWYTKVFGFKTAHPFEVAPIGLRGIFLVDEDGFAIELLEKQGSARNFKASNVAEAALNQGFGHICYRVSDVTAMNARLIEHGAVQIMPVQPAPEPGVTMAYVADPEGNLIEIIDRKGAVS
jgi:catechol 2,3-dioxygenase-like lactoylglutathione lyase family enzyme